MPLTTPAAVQGSTAQTSSSKREPEPPLLKDHKVPKRWRAVASRLEKRAQAREAEEAAWRSVPMPASPAFPCWCRRVLFRGRPDHLQHQPG